MQKVERSQGGWTGGLPQGRHLKTFPGRREEETTRPAGNRRRGRHGHPQAMQEEAVG